MKASSRSRYGKSIYRSARKVAGGVAATLGGMAAQAGYRAFNQTVNAAANAAVRGVKRRLTYDSPPTVRRPQRGFNIMIPAGRRRIRGSRYSKSAGFFKKGRKFKGSRRDRKIMSGVVYVKETAGTIEPASSVPAVYIGHSTNVTNQMRYQIWRAIMKKMYEKVFGCSPYDFSTSRFSNGGRFILEWEKAVYTQPDNEIYVSASAVSLATVVAYFADSARTYHQNWYSDPTTTNIQEGQVMLRSFTFEEKIDVAGTPVYFNRHLIRLDDSLVEFDIKSSLKLQNRSINSDGNDQAEDVDNVPLFGRSYYGNGCDFYHIKAMSNELGVLATGRVPYSFTADNNTGLIVNLNESNSNGLREPPIATEIIGVKSSGKAKLDPGEIKTSNLQYRAKMKLNTIYRQLVPSTGVNLTNRLKRHGYGKSCFFGFEKMINAASLLGMKIAYEVQNRSVVNFIEVRSKITSQVTDVV